MKRILLFLACSFIAANLLSQFRATMVNSQQGNQRNYNVYIGNDQYRYEFSEDGMDGIIIVKPSENKTFILIPEKKFVHITECDGSMSRMNDPVQAYATFKSYGLEKKEGSEKLGAFNCTKYGLYQEDTRIFTMWFSDELNFPIKIKSELDEGTYMELNDIKRMDPDAGLFIVPTDYTEVDRQLRPVIPEPPPPEEWIEKKAELPLNLKLERGTRVLLGIPESVYYKFKLENNGDTPSKIIYRLYQDGNPLDVNIQGRDKYRTYRLFPGEKKTLTQDWKKDYELRIEVYEGTMDIEIVME